MYACMRLHVLVTGYDMMCRVCRVCAERVDCDAVSVNVWALNSS